MKKCIICGEERGEDWLAAHVKAEHLPLTPNAIDCLDCEEIYEVGPECPEEPAEHAIQAAFVTNEPLGLADDANYYHHGREQYEYSGQGIVRDVS
jgi:hypothetical protein